MYGKSYFDLCISKECFEADNAEETLKLFYEYGYRTIAINHELDESSQNNENENRTVGKKKKKKLNQILQNQTVNTVPEPVNLDKRLLERYSDLKVLKRLSVSFSQSDFYHKVLKCPNYKKYDILGILPRTQSALLFTCSNIDADIFMFDPELKSPLKFNRKTYYQLVNKGFYFEILYSPTIQDETKRKNTINVSHLYHVFGKSKNVIISSGASKRIYIRNPYDIINLGLIFGLNEQQSKDSVSTCPSDLYKKAIGRCHGKTIMFVENVRSESANNVSTIEIEETDDEKDGIDRPVSKRLKENDVVLVE